MKNFYDRIIKRIIDFVLSLAGIIVLIPVWIILAVAIKIDDPGPVLFKQKRIARDNKDGTVKYFYILKYRSMKTSTPKDMPTHLLKNPEQYITRVGGFLRKTSLDELPQIFNIFLGHQTDLYEERAKYGANKVRPGLTGWAQINGRDELLIEDKARLDGEYVSRMSLLMDLKCFFGTFLSVLRQDGVVEGGTGSINNDDANKEQ